MHLIHSILSLNYVPWGRVTRANCLFKDNVIYYVNGDVLYVIPINDSKVVEKINVPSSTHIISADKDSITVGIYSQTLVTKKNEDPKFIGGYILNRIYRDNGSLTELPFVPMDHCCRRQVRNCDGELLFLYSTDTGYTLASLFNGPVVSFPHDCYPISVVRNKDQYYIVSGNFIQTLFNPKEYRGFVLINPNGNYRLTHTRNMNPTYCDYLIHEDKLVSLCSPNSIEGGNITDGSSFTSQVHIGNGFLICRDTCNTILANIQ